MKEDLRDVADIVRELFHDNLGVRYEDIHNESHIENDLGADSLDKIEMIMALEEAFDIDVPDKDYEDLATVGDTIKYVERKVAEKAGKGGQ